MDGKIIFIVRKTFNKYMVDTYVFYLVLFKNFIFRLKEPALIFIGMIIICIVISILINQIEKLIVDGVKSCKF